MLGSKGILTPLIPDCSARCAPAILKNIHNSLIFKNGYLFMFLAGPKVKNPLAGKLASDFQPFDPSVLTRSHFSK